jgi:hypothetical protein
VRQAFYEMCGAGKAFVRMVEAELADQLRRISSPVQMADRAEVERELIANFRSVVSARTLRIKTK